MYLNVLEYELSCTGIYWKFKIVQYWKNENVLENVLECTGISFSILSGHPVGTNPSSKSTPCVSLSSDPQELLAEHHKEFFNGMVFRLL